MIRKNKMNKKGNIMLIIMFFVFLFLILFAGFVMVIGSSVINFIFDVAVPELNDLGMIGPSNFTEIAEITINPLNNIIQNFTWITGVLYMMMLVGSIGMAFAIKNSPSKWLMGFYFLLALILIMGSILISNIYEDFYDDGGDLGDRLKEHTILSFMILYSPMIFSFIVFINGIVLFSGLTEEGFV